MRSKMTVLVLATLCCFAWAAGDAVAGSSPVVHVQSAIADRRSAIVDSADAVTVPQMLSYQGKLTDTLGQPVPDGNYQLTFRLYTAPSGGSAFWTEGQTIVVRNGLFSALLGAVTPIGSVPDAGALYLSLQVAVDPELSPRLRIASAAYSYLAARAADADLLQGKDTTALDARFVNESQANSVTGAMLVDGTVLTADVGDTAVTMAKLARAGATTGQVVKWTGSAWAPGPDNTGGGSGVTNVYQDTGIVCVPNPITSTGNVKLDLAYSDGRYVNVPGDSMTGSLAVQGDLRVLGKGRVGPGNSNAGTAAFVAGSTNSAQGNFSTIAGGYSDTTKGLYGSVLSGYSNLAGDAAVDTAVTVCGGWNNAATGRFAFVGGGAGNGATENHSVVVGGYLDTVTSICGAALSGCYNKAGLGTPDSGATIAGGGHNTVAGAWTFVGGGSGNTAFYSHATVGGGRENCAVDYYATVGGGLQDTASADYATVGGGRRNKATADHATVSGGTENIASAAYAAVGGGGLNRAAGSYAVVGGGFYSEALASASTVAGGFADTVHAEFGAVGGGCGNLAGFGAYDTGATVAGGAYNKVLGKWSMIGGGTGNTVSSAYGTIGGGSQNSASSQYTTVGGGVQDTASGMYSAVGGGYKNKAGADCAAVPGGYGNIAGGPYSMVGGGLSNRSSGSYSVACGGMQNAAFAMCPTVGGGFADTVKADHGVVGGGYCNQAGDAADDTAAVIAGGWNNTATGKFNFIGGGYLNSSSNNYSTIAGGTGNTASGPQASVLGGWGNTASGYHSVVAGGLENVASGTASTVSGGEDNAESGYWSTIAGGRNDTCLADYALLSGCRVRARAAADYTLAFGEDCSTSTARAVVFYHSGAATKLGVGVQNPTHYVDVTGGSYCDASGWHNGSSRELKRDIVKLTPEECRAILQQLLATDVARYKYRLDERGREHVGLIAEEAPDVLTGPEHKAIGTGDAIGFLMAAVKAQQAEIEALKARLK